MKEFFIFILGVAFGAFGIAAYVIMNQYDNLADWWFYR